MKLFPALLAVSLVTNAALVAVWVLSPADSPPPSLGPAISGLAGAASNRAPVSTERTAAGKNDRDSTGPWSNLGTDSLAGTVARLRAAGFPTAVLRAVVEQSFAARWQQLLYAEEGIQPYWKSRPRSQTEATEPKIAAALAQLDQERAAALKQLVGVDATRDSDEARGLRAATYGSLPDEKIFALQALYHDYSTKFSQLRDGNGDSAPTDQTAVGLQKEMQDAMAKLLTPDELLEYNLRNSPSSARLRQSLIGLKVTEAEFRALYPLYQAVDDQTPAGPFSAGAAPGQMDARLAAEAQNQEQIKAILGPDRYADYQQSSQPQYQQLNALVVRLDLPLSAAAQVATIQQDVQQRAAAVRTDRKLSTDARTAQITALAQEATTRIAATLGDRGLEGYKQNGGQWLNQLQPRPRANSKSP